MLQNFESSSCTHYIIFFFFYEYIALYMLNEINNYQNTINQIYSRLLISRDSLVSCCCLMFTKH